MEIGNQRVNDFELIPRLNKKSGIPSAGLKNTFLHRGAFKCS